MDCREPKSTGHRRYEEAVAWRKICFAMAAIEIQPTDLVLSDTEFEEIQRRHFGKKKDACRPSSAQKSLKSCLEAISAFREITGISPIALATPDDCERFQFDALKRAKNWRKLYPKSRKREWLELGPIPSSSGCGSFRRHLSEPTKTAVRNACAELLMNPSCCCPTLGSNSPGLMAPSRKNDDSTPRNSTRCWTSLRGTGPK